MPPLPLRLIPPGRGALLGGSTKTLGDRMQAGGLYTHDDTLVAVVASRYGRDLAGIADAYRAEYDGTLLEELAATVLSSVRSSYVERGGY